MKFATFNSGMPELADHICGIYIIGPGPDGPVKVGISGNLQKRLLALQSGCWMPLKCFGFYLSLPDAPSTNYRSMQRAFLAGARSLETRLHREMDKHELALLGEWLDLTPHEALDVLKKCGEMNNQKVATIKDFAGVDIVSGHNDVMAARQKIVRSLAEINTFVHACNDRADKYANR